MKTRKSFTFFLIFFLALQGNGIALAPWHEKAPLIQDRLDPQFKALVEKTETTKIGFHEQGGVWTNQADLITGVLGLQGDLELDDAFDDLPPLWETASTHKISTAPRLDPFLEGLEFQRWVGRTAVFYNPDKNVYQAFKFLKESERSAALYYENEWFDFIQHYYDPFGLIGQYPNAVQLDGERVMQFEHVPEFLLNLFEQWRQTHDEPISLSVMEAKNKSGYTVMSYEVKSLDYFRYINDPDLTDEEFERALYVNFHDYMVLAKRGILHTRLISALHELSASPNNDRGRYLWMVDVINKFEDRPGAGRLHAWLDALKYSNLRISGLADFAELGFIDDLAVRTAYLSRSLHLLTHHHFEYRRKIIWANYLGELLLVSTLMLGEKWRKEDKWDWQDETTLKPYAEKIKTLFSTFYLTFDSDAENLNYLADKIDWLRLVRQMAFFMAKGEPYLPYLIRGSQNPEQGFPSEIFNVPVQYPDDVKPSLGYIETETKTGFYWKAFERDFLERILTRLSKKYQVSNADELISWPQTRIWPANNKSLLPLLAELQRTNEEMYQEFLESLPPDLGVVHGPFPIQELIQALYLFSASILVDPIAPPSKEQIDWSKVKVDIGALLGEGYEARLNGTYHADTKQNFQNIGALRFKEKSAQETEETLEAIKLAKAVLAKKPAIKDHLMKVFLIDDEKEVVYVELVDVEYEGRVINKKPTKLQEYLRASPNKEEKYSLLLQALKIFLELRIYNPGQKRYDFGDSNLNNYLVTIKNGKKIIIRIDYEAFLEVDVNKQEPFTRMAFLIKDFVFPKVLALNSMFFETENFDEFKKGILEAESRVRLSSFEEQMLTLIYLLLDESVHGIRKESFIYNLLLKYEYRRTPLLDAFEVAV